MLSRVANTLYWMVRYVERADNLARLIDVNQQLLLDSERLDSEPCRQFAGIYQQAVFNDRPLTAAEVAQLEELLGKI